MNLPRPLEFPEITSTQINVALVADKLNEVIAYLKAQEASQDLPLAPGIVKTRNGRFMKNGKFISKEEAYVG